MKDIEDKYDLANENIMEKEGMGKNLVQVKDLLMLLLLILKLKLNVI